MILHQQVPCSALKPCVHRASVQCTVHCTRGSPGPRNSSYACAQFLVGSQPVNSGPALLQNDRKKVRSETDHLCLIVIKF